jgi:phosphoenolpyruvate synthase/pyruvate phosphate dikinase
MGNFYMKSDSQKSIRNSNMIREKIQFKKNYPLLINLNSATAVPFTQVGGKAWRLAQLRAAGFPVPEGWVITDTAFKKFCRFNEIMIEASQLEINKKVDQILSGELPLDMKNEINTNLEMISYNQFAVRSSSAAEDNPDSSMAGQFVTCLNVPRENIGKAVKKCWASLFGDAAQAYLRKRSSGCGYQMGVIIQKQIHPFYSGVIFTIDP